jgi:hypothetical protein
VRLKLALYGGVAAALMAGTAFSGSLRAERQASVTPPMTRAPAAQAYAPYLREPPETNLYWGDLHLHTNLSTDAYVNGTRRVGHEQAYRFAAGGSVVGDNGITARLRRPLDFLAVTDHGENLGLYPEITSARSRLAGTPLAARWGEVLGLIDKVGLREAFMTVTRQHGPMPDLPQDVLKSIWSRVAHTADAHYRPGRFTTLIGYEWTSMIDGDNLHRVVLFRDAAAKVETVLPVSAQDSSDPEHLWAALARYEDTGGKVLAIAHNGNLSNGRMFSPTRINGQPIDRKYAETRARWEPVYEVTQVKGDGEAHPTLSPTDEFANFELWDQWNVARTARKQPWMLRYEYARSALRDGLLIERRVGANPFKFGMIGSTDSHTGLSTTEEDNYYGKFPSSEPAPGRAFGTLGETNWELGASGLAAVWAPENTREAIFDALRRREVYATTGTRIRLRFFGGWNFAANDIERADYARLGYRQGVPMGSDLVRRTGAAAPTFLIHAVRDPLAANLDRVQVVKGWVDAAGRGHERIYDVAHPMPRGGRDRGVPAGSNVDLKTATYRNSIGAPELATWWRDPDFKPGEAAFYYVRVLEIPTPRWTTYDAAYFRTPLAPQIPRLVQERAYSSPIWYRP